MQPLKPGKDAINIVSYNDYDIYHIYCQALVGFFSLPAWAVQVTSLKDLEKLSYFSPVDEDAYLVELLQVLKRF